VGRNFVDTKTAAGYNEGVGGGNVISGGVYGALNPDSAEANAHAKRYYTFVRSTQADIEAIAKNTGLDAETVAEVKRYLFIDEHELGGVLGRFDPNYQISQSWQRLWEGKNIAPHDKTLLDHEIYERELVKTGTPQARAHIIASSKFNYSREVEEYYAATNQHRKNQ
jgi:hypothetical protein